LPEAVRGVFAARGDFTVPAFFTVSAPLDFFAEEGLLGVMTGEVYFVG
jgi:hypothetical protein